MQQTPLAALITNVLEERVMTTVHPIPPPADIHDLLTYEPETGLFRWKIARGSRAKVDAVTGFFNKGSGYITLCLNKRHFKAHRLAWYMTYAEWPSLDIDHINGVRTDNRLVNLRLATRSQNNQNQRRARKDNTHGYLGVTVLRTTTIRPWRAAIHLDGKRMHLGCFDTPEEAHAAYLAAKRRLHEHGMLGRDADIEDAEIVEEDDWLG